MKLFDEVWSDKTKVQDVTEEIIIALQHRILFVNFQKSPTIQRMR